MTKPCCCDGCCGLKGCCIAIGITTIVLGCIGVLYGGLCIKVVDDGKAGPGISRGGLMAIVALYMVVSALYIGVGILLLIGATNKNQICCWIYIGGSIGLFILDTIFGSIIVAHYSPQKEHDMTFNEYLGWYIFTVVVWIILQVYFIWVVYSFIKEIKK